jgi:hypothetical protein
MVIKVENKNSINQFQPSRKFYKIHLLYKKLNKCETIQLTEAQSKAINIHHSQNPIIIPSPQLIQN